MNSNEILKNIRDYADEAHADQMRKYTPERYIVHPVRVMEMLQSYTSDIAVFAAALLHDVLEDTPRTKEDLAQFLKTLMDDATVERTVNLVIELTDVFITKDYPKWNRRKRKSMELERIMTTSSLAQTIKYADIMDNCNEIVAHDRNFAKVFLYECKRLLDGMDKGDPDLYKKAKEMVDCKIIELRSGKLTT
jgi:guanosine-3',5'-bis(diphosphate) 3'-pyrophosphohydrolase